MLFRSATSLARLPTQRLFDGVSDSSKSPPILPGLVFIIIDLLFRGGICGSIGILGLTTERESDWVWRDIKIERFDFGEWSREKNEKWMRVKRGVDEI